MSETRIHRTYAELDSAPTESWHDVPFTVERAKRALVYVASIVVEASESFHVACECRRALALASSQSLRIELASRRDAALRRLNHAIDDCNAVGADLISIPNCIVRFAAIVDGRRTSLVWRRGEPIESAWDILLNHASVAI